MTGDIQIAAFDELKAELNINTTTGDIKVNGTDYDDNVRILSKDNSGVLNINVTTGDVILETSNKM